MAEAEKKNIAKLDFNINDAINSLDLVDKKLKSIAESSNKYAERISKNISSGITVNINSNELQKNLSKVENLSKNTQEQLLKNSQKNQYRMTEITLAEEEKRKTAAYKSALAQEQYNERVAKSTESLYDKITQYAKTYVIYQGFNALKQGIKETVDEMVQVEQQMVAIDRVMNEDSLNIDNYREKLIQLAYDYGNSFNNVADITLRLAQAGFDSRESIALTEKTLLALNTAELDATQATDDMVAVMAQWGLMTGDAKEEADSYASIIDKINKVADNFPTTSADLMDALKKVSSAFNLAGASIDETIALIVAAEKSSQRGGKVIGTALSNIVQQIKAEGKLNLAEEMGLNFYTDETKTQFKNVIDIFEEMAERMQALKDAGKESSVEMQSLLELFTVFRRNIGASLLGEMSGEDNTYLQALETSINSVGYSLQENEKYMKTAKAAQEQFNAELLKLKTQVWENGLEGTFRDMLSMGIDMVKGIGNIIDKFGILPTTIGVAVASFTALNKKIQLFTYDSKTSTIQLNGFFKSIADGTQNIRKVNKIFTEFNNENATMGERIKNNAMLVSENTKSMVKYGASLVANTAKTIALQVATVALNAAISLGVSLAITALVSAIDNWIHAEENATKALQESKQAAENNAEQIKSERENLQDLTKQYNETIKKYKELKEARSDTTETESKLYELQAQINEALEGTGKQVNIINSDIDEQGNKIQKVNDKYQEQINLLQSITYQKKKDEVEELRKAAEDAQNLMVGIGSDKFSEDFWGNKLDQIQKTAGINLEQFETDVLNKVFKDTNTNVDELDKKVTNLTKDLGVLDFKDQKKYLLEWQEGLKRASREGKDVSEALEWVNEKLSEFEEQEKTAQAALDKYNNALRELYLMSGQIDSFNTFLDSIAGSYNLEGPQALIDSLKGINQQFVDGQIDVEQYFNKIQEKISEIDLSAQGEELEAYQAIFAATTESLAEGISELNAGLESGTINFADYASGTKEAAENMLALRIEQNQLTLDSENVWRDAGNNVDEYANSLQNAIDELSNMGELLTVIGDNYDYIAEHANAAGEAAFKQADVTTEAYQTLATNVANSLISMRESNNDAYNAIVDKVFEATGDIANEETNANDYINRALNEDANALNAALNEGANQVSLSTSKVTQSMGKVISALGKAISNFEYKLTAQPFISGDLKDAGLKIDENGKMRFNLPKFGYDFSGSGGDSINELSASLEAFGEDLEDLGENQFKYTTLKSVVQPYSPTTRGGSGNAGSSSRSGSSSGGSSTATDNTKAEEDTYKQRLNNFKNYITEQERLEKRWVDEQKELGLLSNDDYLYITQQRIERYKKYLEEVKKATWMNEEDKLELEKQYSEKIKDLQVDYLGYLKDKMDEEVKELKEKNKEKIQAVKDEATQRINALKKVEKENDRIRKKEEYEKKRQEHLEDISYWEQRTGREAQEALKEARKNLQELDEEWEDQLEDWSIDDQIKDIENERDAQIKAIEAAQETEIAAIEAIYDEKVRRFAETGEIIYEGSVIQSKKLYNQYKTNFIDPIEKDLKKLNTQEKKPTTAAKPKTQAQKQEQQYETYVIQRGDTLSAIARRYGTTVDKIMTANPYIKNRNLIYTGNTLQIPKFHEGGIASEGLALLKKNEMILKPEWTPGMLKLMKYIDKNFNTQGQSTSAGNKIQVTRKFSKHTS